MSEEHSYSASIAPNQFDESGVRREYPTSPRVAVGAVVLAGPSVLLIRRGREPLMGEWSLPGGVLELGETLAEGIVREVMEETGVRIEPVEVLWTLDRIVRDESSAVGGCGRVRYHYVIVDWLCRAFDPTVAVAGDDAQEVRWADGEELASYHLPSPIRHVIELAFQRDRLLRAGEENA